MTFYTPPLRTLFLILPILLGMIMISVPNSANASDGLTPQKEQQIKRLMELTNLTDMFKQMQPLFAHKIQQELIKDDKQVDDATIQRIATLITDVFAEAMPALEAELTLLYAELFTEQEIADVVAFYETPTGQKTLTSMPKLMQASMILVEQWATQTITPLLKARIAEEMLIESP